MNGGLTIFRKGLVLVAIPLLAQLIFIGILLVSRVNQQDAQFWAIHTKKVIALTEAAHRTVVETQTHMRGYALTGDRSFHDRYREARAEIPDRFAELRAETKDNAEQLEKLHEITDAVDGFVSWMDDNCRLIAEGNRKTAVERIRSHGGTVQLQTIRDKVDEFLDEENRLDDQRREQLHHTSSVQFAVMLGGLALAIGSSGLLLLVFSRSIAERLAVLTMNTRRLSEGQELVPPLEGRDELAQLDRVFHDMAGSLRQKDQENEMFVYSVSHDLRSPLVNLQGFSQELTLTVGDIRKLLADPSVPAAVREKAEKLLDRNVAEAVQFIRSAVTRLAGIIDALLRLSRVGRVEYHWQQVDVQEVVQRIVGAMHDSVRRKDATVVVGELPPCWGDPRAVDQVFANLLTNAVNYLAPDRPGRVEVGCSTRAEAPGMNTYHVKDNGPGIAAAFQSKIFVAFQRLHPDAAPGEGIGLTLVRRVVERHGGKVWLESVEGEGTTFFVALPPPLPAEKT